MNKIFDFSRFGKVFIHDFRSAYAQFGILVLILALLPHLGWLMGLTDGFKYWSNYFTLDPAMRYTIICMVTTLAACMAPSRIYKNANLTGKGNYFAMLPASLPEKYVSMLVWSIILAPLAVFAGSLVVDMVLTLLPFGPYRQYIWDGWFLFWQPNGPVYYDSVTGIEANMIQAQVNVITVLYTLMIPGIFLFTNTIFKKHKVTKTFLWMALIGFVLMITLVPIWNHNMDAWLEWLKPWVMEHSAKQLVNIVFWCMASVLAVIDFLLFFFTYRRLKRMQY